MHRVVVSKSWHNEWKRELHGQPHPQIYISLFCRDLHIRYLDDQVFTAKTSFPTSPLAHRPGFSELPILNSFKSYLSFLIFV